MSVDTAKCQLRLEPWIVGHSRFRRDKISHCLHNLDTLWLARLLKESHHTSKPVEILETTVASAVPKGENYTSTVSRVKIRCLLASGLKKTFSIIVKTELKSEKAREIIENMPVFRSEIGTYTSTLKKMEALADEFGDKREILWAKLYGYQPYNLVAFEDLTDLGYAVAQRRNFLDLNHGLLVLRNLARFHAMSKVLMSRGLLDSNDKGIFALAMDNEPMKKMWEVVITVLTDCIEKDWGSEWAALAEKIRKAGSNVLERMIGLASSYDKNFEVLNHGDLWTCNMMFKNMEYDNYPISVRFIDLQICHMNSFIWDIEYFFNTSVVPKVKREKRPILLKAYHEALVKNLELYQYSGYVPTLEDIENESRRIEFGHFALSTFSPLMSADTTEAFDMEKLMTHPPEEVIKREVFISSNVKENLGEDLKHFSAIGVI
ncbi:Hypothetical protein NTJ_03098 [Nesidiocoris tenuis]|uniref:CHK kinase-like domain-containing protein n=1 Tax=Nesidiocoris tenuis TaxID=355587 RepID=A0ABN7ADD0_9HEMI|nr:Hypothetical protein NTJ_03098 [Nesidiocoris tenuis]